MMRNVLLSLIVVASFAVPAGAAEPFIALVDLDRGLLLIPEGTAVPTGVEFYLEPDDAPAVRAGAGSREGFAGRALQSGAQDVVATTEAAPKRLVYAYAPVSQFATARQRIQEGRSHDVRTLVADMDQYYYFYFYDGSYHGARKYIRNLPGFPYSESVQYGTDTIAFTTSGDFDTKTSISQTSTVTPFWNKSNACWFYGVEGTCNILLHAVQTSPTFTGSITSKASIVHYLYPPCSTPCKVNLSSTIVISFP